MSLLITQMQPLIGMYEAKRLDKNEQLFSRYGAWNLFGKYNGTPDSIISPADRTRLENSWGNEVKIPVMEGIDGIAIGTTRSCNFTINESTTNEVVPTFSPYVWKFSMYPNQYMTGNQAINYVRYDNDFLHKADTNTLVLMKTLDTAARNAVESNKNIYWPPNISAAYYSIVGDALQIPDSDKTDAFNKLSAIMDELDFYAYSDILGSTTMKPLTNRLEAQGEGNATNEKFQFLLGNFTFTSSNRVTNNVGIRQTGYMIQPGQLANYNRNNPNARARSGSGQGQTIPRKEWDLMVYPLLGMEVGTFYMVDCGDSTGNVTNADVAGVQEMFCWDTEIGFITPYPSSPSTKQQGIVKFEISIS
jgi:hypothetical protein